MNIFLIGQFLAILEAAAFQFLSASTRRPLSPTLFFLKCFSFRQGGQLKQDAAGCSDPFIFISLTQSYEIDALEGRKQSHLHQVMSVYE